MSMGVGKQLNPVNSSISKKFGLISRAIYSPYMME